jgi:hypothetical protein
MNDASVDTITKLLEFQDPEILENVATDALPGLIERAKLYVTALKPPQSAFNQLVMLYTGALITNYDGESLSMVKINNIQVTASNSASGNAWLDEFNSLLNALGVGRAEVTGF